MGHGKGDTEAHRTAQTSLMSPEASKCTDQSHEAQTRGNSAQSSSSGADCPLVSKSFSEPLNQTDVDSKAVGIGIALLQRRPETMAQTAA